MNWITARLCFSGRSTIRLIEIFFRAGLFVFRNPYVWRSYNGTAAPPLYRAHFSFHLSSFSLSLYPSFSWQNASSDNVQRRAQSHSSQTSTKTRSTVRVRDGCVHAHALPSDVFTAMVYFLLVNDLRVILMLYVLYTLYTVVFIWAIKKKLVNDLFCCSYIFMSLLQFCAFFNSTKNMTCVMYM